MLAGISPAASRRQWLPVARQGGTAICNLLIPPVALADGTGLPLQGGRSYIKINAEFTLFRDAVWTMTREAMSICRDFRAITRGASARPGAALILGGLLLLSVP